MKLINRTKELVTIDIVLQSGTTDSVNIQPQSRVTLPAGATICPNKEAMYARIVKVVASEAPQPTASDIQDESVAASEAQTSSTS